MIAKCNYCHSYFEYIRIKKPRIYCDSCMPAVNKIKSMRVGLQSMRDDSIDKEPNMKIVFAWDEANQLL